MKLYHPSNKKFDIIKVKYFGKNWYTRNDYKVSGVKRTFWYLTPNIPEKRFQNCRYIYMIDINEQKLYDLRKDPKNLSEKYPNVNDLLIHLKKYYLGAIYKPTTWNLIIIFEDMKPKKIIERKCKNEIYT